MFHKSGYFTTKHREHWENWLNQFERIEQQLNKRAQIIHSSVLFFISYIFCVWAYIRHKNTSTNNRYLCWMYVCVFVWLANKRATERTNEWMNVRAMESCLHDNCSLCLCNGNKRRIGTTWERARKEQTKKENQVMWSSNERPSVI